MRSDTTSWWRREDWDIWSIGLNIMTLFLAPTVPPRSVEYDLGSRNSFVQWIMVVVRNLKEKVEDILWREGVYLKRERSDQ